MDSLRRSFLISFFFVLMMSTFDSQKAAARDTEIKGPRVAILPTNKASSPPKPVIKKKDKPAPKKEEKKPENLLSPRDQAESEEAKNKAAAEASAIAEEQAKKDAAAKALREEMEAVDEAKATKESEERRRQCRSTFACVEEHCQDTPYCQKARATLAAEREAGIKKAADDAKAKAEAEAKKKADAAKPKPPPSPDSTCVRKKYGNGRITTCPRGCHCS